MIKKLNIHIFVLSHSLSLLHQGAMHADVPSGCCVNLSGFTAHQAGRSCGAAAA